MAARADRSSSPGASFELGPCYRNGRARKRDRFRLTADIAMTAICAGADPRGPADEGAMTLVDGSASLRIGFLTVPNYSMIAFANAVEPLRMANRLSGRTLCSWS